MSGAIKPPGGGAGPIDPMRGGQAPDPAQAVGQAESTMGAADVTGAQASSATGTAAWLERVDAGQITPEEAVDGIVADALEVHGGARLPEAQRAELAGALKAALLEDPALSALLMGHQS